MSQFRVLILAVVSSPGQATSDKTSLKDQVKAAEAFAEQMDAQIVETLAFVHSRNYKTLDALCLDSPEYAQFIELVRSQAINLVIIWRKNRLGRTSRLQLEVIEFCADWGVQVHGLQDALHPPKPPGEFWAKPRTASETFMTTVSAGWAQADNEQRVEDMMRGKRGRAEKGLHMAWTTLPYGYQAQDGDHGLPLVPRPSEWPWLRTIIDQRLAGTGVYRIGQFLNDQGVRTRQNAYWESVKVSRILHNPYYAGLIRYRRFRKLPSGKRVIVSEELFPGIHQPAMTADEWDALQRINGSRARDYAPRSRDPYLLTGLLRCGFCGDAMSITVQPTGPHHRLICARYVRSGGRECECNYHNSKNVYPVVLDAVRSLIGAPESTLHLYGIQRADSEAQEREALLAQLDALAQRQQRLMDALEEGTYSRVELSRRHAANAQQVATVKARIAEIDHRAASYDTLVRRAHDLRGEPLATLDAQQQRGIIKTLVRRVVLTKGHPPLIEWLE